MCYAIRPLDPRAVIHCIHYDLHTFPNAVVIKRSGYPGGQAHGSLRLIQLLREMQSLADQNKGVGTQYYCCHCFGAFSLQNSTQQS
jgi:hypothetical protein